MKNVQQRRLEAKAERLPSRPVTAAAADGKWLYRVGGLSGLGLGVGYLIIMALYMPLGAPPTGAEPRLVYLAGHPVAWGAIFWLSILTDFLFVPVTLALYRALRAINRDAMLIATAGVGLFIVLDLAVTWTNYAALLTLSGQYAAVTTDAQRAVFVAAAQYPSAVLESSLFGVYSTLTLAVGILIIGGVMRQARFSQSTAYWGVATGLLGIVAVIGPFFVSFLGAVIILASLATTIWVMLAGYQLYRLARPVLR